jgi:hypothetical protein
MSLFTTRLTKQYLNLCNIDRVARLWLGKAHLRGMMLHFKLTPSDAYSKIIT